MTRPAPWRVFSAAVAGRGHRENRKACQDCCSCSSLRRGGQAFAIGVVADGAGSAKYGRLGARLACQSLEASAKRMVKEHPQLGRTGRDQAVAMFREARDSIIGRARRRAARDYATTAALAILGPDGCVFASVGDSAIVARGRGGYQPVFWPENGEFASTTSFLTEGDFEDRLQFEARPATVDELAMFTDGLNPVALDLCGRTAHGPFFTPLFLQLRAAVRRRTARRSVERGLCRFLASEALERRVDDDRSLVLICSHKRDVDGSDLPR
jgi:hypothetical protein